MDKQLLIDSDILIDHLRKNVHALNFLSREIEKGPPVFVSVISRTEILAGVRKGEEEAVNSLFDVVNPIDVDIAISDTAGEYLRRFGKSHALNIGDAIIAATVKEMSLKLVTKNIKHYPMKDIDILKPY